MFKRHEEQIKGTNISEESLATLNGTLKNLERFWAAQANFSGGY